jgi:hypothetical protein
MARIAGWEGDSGEPSLRIKSPNGGESWMGGSKHNITWVTTGDVGRLMIEYSVDGGDHWDTVVSSTKNDGVYRWTVPDENSDDCLVRISEVNGDLVDTSNNYFSIIDVDSPPKVRITSPANNSVVDGTITVRANASDDFGVTKVEFYINNDRRRTDSSSPYRFQWDTTSDPSGLATILAVATDTNNQQGSYSISVTVRNITISLQASRHEERAWIVLKQYGKIDVTTVNIGSMTVPRYIVYRREGGGVFSSLTEIQGSEAVNGSFTYYDKYLDQNRSYTYRVEALDSNGNVIAVSQEITI